MKTRQWVVALAAIVSMGWVGQAAFPRVLAQEPAAAGMEKPGAVPGDEGKAGTRDVVVQRQDATVGKGEEARDVVVVFGNVRVEGDVQGNAVAVFGNVQVKGVVHGDAVAVVGKVTLEDGAEVKGDVVGLVGGVKRADGARIGGDLVNLGWEAIPGWLRERGRLFLEECVMLGRPLSTRVDFVWWLWAGLLLFEALLAAAFPEAVRGLGHTLRERPLGSALMGLAGIPLLMLLAVTLGATVLLAPAVVLLFPAVVMSVALGEAACLRVLGAAMLRIVRATPFPAALEFGLGAVLLTCLFLVPFVGILAWTAIDVWVFGGVLLSILRRESRGAKDRVPGAVAMDLGAERGPEAPVVAAAATSPGVDAVARASDGPVPPLPRTRRWHDAETGPLMDAMAVEMAARPGLGRRLAALMIDWVPLLVIAGNLPDGWDGVFRVGGAMAYYATMLAWRGTTLGGLVAGVRVVRTDGRPMDRPTAVVRALASVLSVLSLGLGWLWASWDDRRQTWHDRIAGTVVVRDDTGRSLV